MKRVPIEDVRVGLLGMQLDSPPGPSIETHPVSLPISFTALVNVGSSIDFLTFYILPILSEFFSRAEQRGEGGVGCVVGVCHEEGER